METTDYIQQAIDSCRDWYDISRGLAALAIQRAPKLEQVSDGIWSISEAEIFYLADQIKHEIESAVDDIPNVTWQQALIVQLVSNSLGQIDYHDMARFYLERERN